MSPAGSISSRRRLGRLADPRRAQRAAGQDGFGGGRADRGGRDAAEGQPQAAVHFGGRHDDQAEVTVPPGELGEAPPAQGRELHRLDELVVVQAGLQRAGEQVRGRDLAPAAPGPRRVATAPDAAATTGSSAAGSACARLPPRVPRVRMAAWPTQRAASASSGCLPCAASARCRVRAPIRSPPPGRVLIPSSPGTRLMSTSTLGWARRSASSGIRLWPPAMTLPSPSSLASASCATACSTLSART